MQYFARKFNVHDGQKKTMTGCRVWGIILFAVLVWETTADSNMNVEQISANEADKRPFETDKYFYSWTGPNALARSALMERQEMLQYNCELESNEVDTLNPESFRNILVDDSHELLYCYVPKVQN